MEIARMWTLNTAHISRETANWLDSKECNLGVIKYESGWIIDIPGWITFDKNDILKVPEDLFVLISDARDIRVAKLQLDSDGLIDKSYKIYDWEDEKIPVIGILYAMDGNLHFWHDFDISKEDENKIWEILSKYDTSGIVISGTKYDVVNEIDSMYSED